MSEKRRYGYIRVSTKHQNEARQRDALLKEGIDKRDLFIDKMSGKTFDRPALNDLRERLQPGDEVVVLDLDRLGRDYYEMADVWRDITKNKQADITIINFPILSTSAQSDKTFDTRFINELIFSILSYIAQKEREKILERQKEGIASAKANGTKFGRPRVEKPDNFSEVFMRVWRHEITHRKAMEILELKPSTYQKFAKQEEEKLLKEQSAERS